MCKLIILAASYAAAHGATANAQPPGNRDAKAN
jgi:hypothetical protein